MIVTNRTMWNVVCALAILALAAVPGLASPIFVANFSFEELPAGGLPFHGCIGCAWSQDAIPGWTTTGTALTGQFQPTDIGHFNTLSDGPTSAYSNGGVISQIVVPSMELGYVYLLLVDIGWRNDLPFGGSASLSIAGTTVALAAGTPVQGIFSTYQATYTGTAGDVGKSLAINLVTASPQGNFDNVRMVGLDPVPEPVPFVLIGAALLVLPVLRRLRTDSKIRA